MFYRWLEGNDFLAVKADRQDPPIIINARKLASLLTQIPRQAIETSKDERKQPPQQETPNQLAVTIVDPNQIATNTVQMLNAGKPTAAVNLSEPLGGNPQPVSKGLLCFRR